MPISAPWSVILTAAVAFFLAFGTPIGAAPFNTPSQVATEIASFQTNQAALINSYLKTYGSRFTTAEKSSFTKAQQRTDQSLLALQRETRKIDRLVKSGAPQTRIRAAITSAQRAHAKADTDTLKTQEVLEPILRNRLSIFEAINAYRDYSRALDTFAEIGEQIDGIAARYT